MGYQASQDGLASLTPPAASVPETRVKDAGALQSQLQRFISNDLEGGRSAKRAKVLGLIDGNAPYSGERLKRLGRKDACNVNFGTARSYVQQAEGIFYDLTTESKTQMQIFCAFGKLYDRMTWSQIMSEEAHEALNRDPRWDYVQQCSIHQMVMHGCGPLWFENARTVVPRRCNAGDLIVPENAESEVSYWEQCFILQEYKPHEVYEMIKDAKAAAAIGWDVEYTRAVIMNALPRPQNQVGTLVRWEQLQNDFKQSSFASNYSADVLLLAHAFWIEFDGSITHAIIEQSSHGSNLNGGQDEAVKYLYFRRGRYPSWNCLVHPMYYDKGNGTHYSVTGLGIPMYAAMNIENRLRCNLVDKAMAPKMVFKPTMESNKPFGLVVKSDYAISPAGFDMQQFAVNGMLEDGMVMLNEVQRTSSANLSTYRHGLSRDSGGNPITAREVAARQQQQYAVANTAISRYYAQLDGLFSEIIRRMADLNNDDPIAKDFRERCQARGVPEECLGRIERVSASRVVGAGSVTLRQAALDKAMGVMGRLPEDGQDNLLDMWLSANLGRRSVRLLNPKRRSQALGTEQQANAMRDVAGMRTGVPPVITPEQSPAVFASTFIGAAGQAVGTLAKGANPGEVIAFVDLAVASGMAHMKRMLGDPLKKPLMKKLSGMIKQLEGVVNGVRKKMAKEQKARQGPSLPPEVQQELAVDAARAQLKLKQMAMSHRQRLQQRAEQHAMELATQASRARVETAAADLRAAGDIRRKRLSTLEE